MYNNHLEELLAINTNIVFADETSLEFKLVIVVDKDIFKVDISLVSENLTQINQLTQQETILKYIEKNGKITIEQCKSILNLEKSRVNEILSDLLKSNKLYRHGQGKATYYDFNSED